MAKTRGGGNFFLLLAVLDLLLPFCRCGNTIIPNNSNNNIQPPSLSRTPPSVTYFSNAVGLTLECEGRGTPPLIIKWLTGDAADGGSGTPVTVIPTIREFRNGSLHFPPFREEALISSVHDGSYRCSVTNPIGTFLSPVFDIRAVVDQSFELSIRPGLLDEGDLIEGNSVLLNCDVKPASLLDFMKDFGWKSIDQYGQQTVIVSDGRKYQFGSGGSLLILATKAQELFICVSTHRLNNKIQSSSPFMLKARGAGVGGGGGSAPTNVGVWQRTIFTEVGKPLDLVSLSSGKPSPSFRWEKWDTSKRTFIPVVSSSSTTLVLGPLLSFPNGVSPSSNGTYRVEVMNTLGSFVLEVDLLVTVFPRVALLPATRTVGNGQNVELACELQGEDDGFYTNHAEITWFHNGVRIAEGGDTLSPRLRISSDKLFISNIKFEDQGLYQCFLKVPRSHHHHSTSSSAASVLFPWSAPELVSTFISQSVEPGGWLSLKCAGVGNPLPVITWDIDGVPLLLPPNPSHSHSSWDFSHFSTSTFTSSNEVVGFVNISNVQGRDGGTYRCLAWNALSTASHSARLNVYGKLFMKEMGQVTLSAGSPTSLLPCLYGGWPVDKFAWTINGSEIDTRKNKSRFRILSNGTLRIDAVDRGKDQGSYVCTVSNNRKGETASGSVAVNVLRPPVISSFGFGDSLQEGQRTSISCNVASGDLPIDIQFLKDGSPLPPSLNVTVMRVKFLSNLIFEELRGVHSGVYTCSASNAAATVNFSAQLTVKVPPSWIQPPTDTRVLLNSDVTLPCVASGNPPPRIQWFFESPLSRTAIRTDHHQHHHLNLNQQKFRVLGSGALLIQGVGPSDVSHPLTCEASNGVGGGGIQKSIIVSVIIPAQVSASPTSVAVAEGLPILLKCQIRGDEPIQVVWRKNSIVLESEDASEEEESRRVVLQTVLHANSTSLLSAELRIARSERSDSGEYSCLGFNQYGRDEDVISLHVKARPRPPQDLIVEEIGSRVIRLKWSEEREAVLKDNPVTHFVLQYKNSSTSSWDSVMNLTVPAPSLGAVVRGLAPLTTYELRILASNEIGFSLPSSPSISVTTLAEAPSGPPLNVTAVATSPRSLLVSWDPPNARLQNGAILGYNVNLSPVLSLISNGSQTIDEKWGHQTEISGLRPNSRYRVWVRAYNVAGIGPESSFVFISTSEGAPDSPPISIVCEPLSPKSLQVYWSPPPEHLANGVVQGYKVIYASVEAEALGSKPEVKKTINKETTLHGLHSYTNYSVKALAFTLAGESPPSQPVFCTTEEDLPDEIADMKVLPSGRNSVVVAWLPPRFPNGVISRYKIGWKSKSSSSSDPLSEPHHHFLQEESGKDRTYYVQDQEEDQMMMEVKLKENNKQYVFWVTPATSLGFGKPSEMMPVNVLSKAPAKIASFPTTRRPKVDASVSLPCRGVGSPAPSISWFFKASSSSSLLPLSPSSQNLNNNGSLFIPRVKEADEGLYVCKAVNSLGVDEIGHNIHISKPPSPFPSPPILGYISGNSVQIHWDPPPAGRPDPPLTGYIIQYKSSSTASEWSFTRLPPRQSSFTLENLLCGTEYLIRLAPSNAVGLGEFSPVARVKTKGGPPDQTPKKLTDIIDGNGTVVRVDLSRWPDGGCRIKKFHLEFRHNDEEGGWKAVPRNSNSSRVFILHTHLGGKYGLRVRLENEAGVVTKTFVLESSPEFFTNYDSLMQQQMEEEEESKASVMGGRSASVLFSDPHIIVPIVSALVSTVAVIICIFIAVKRRGNNVGTGSWKLGNSASQQTWISSDDFRLEKQQGPKMMPKVEGSNVPSGSSSGMSIYATLNSRNPIPMTIRDSTVRFQTFGQVENYDAPPPPQDHHHSSYLRAAYRDNNCKFPQQQQQPSLSHEELDNIHGYQLSQKILRDTLTVHGIKSLRPTSNPNEYTTDDSGVNCHDYADPYQVIPAASSSGPRYLVEGSRGTLRKSKSSGRVTSAMIDRYE